MHTKLNSTCKIQSFNFNMISYVNVLVINVKISHTKKMETIPFNNIAMNTSNMSFLKNKYVSYLNFNSVQKQNLRENPIRVYIYIYI